MRLAHAYRWAADRGRPGGVRRVRELRSLREGWPCNREQKDRSSNQKHTEHVETPLELDGERQVHGRNQRFPSTLPRRPQALDGHLIEHDLQAGRHRPVFAGSETTYSISLGGVPWKTPNRVDAGPSPERDEAERPRRRKLVPGCARRCEPASARHGAAARTARAAPLMPCRSRLAMTARPSSAKACGGWCHAHGHSLCPSHCRTQSAVASCACGAAIQERKAMPRSCSFLAAAPQPLLAMRWAARPRRGAAGVRRACRQAGRPSQPKARTAARMGGVPGAMG